MRVAVREQDVSDDEILNVLQCYDFSVDHAITAFHEGLVIINYFKILFDQGFTGPEKS